MNLKDAATDEAALRALLDRIEAAYKAKRAEVQKLLDEAEKANGQRNVAVDVGGEPVATVNLKPGKAEATVTDDDAFTAWVIEEFPGEVERKFVTLVRPAFRKKLLAQMTAANRAEWVDDNSVIHEVPGVQITPNRGRTHEVRFTGEKGAVGRERIAAAWRSGALALPGVTGPAHLEGGAQ